jgi:hypothetical protein
MMPLPAAAGEAEAEGMHSVDLTSSRILVLGDPLVMRPCRLADRMLARAFGASLDRQLAAGCPPESAWLLAVRAQDIVSLPSRQALARNWDHLLRVARRAPAPRSPAVPICADRIAAAEPAIHELLKRLTTPLPVTAQGVAMASAPLTDATGPVYNRRSPVALAGLLEAAITQLDPALPLMYAA